MLDVAIGMSLVLALFAGLVSGVNEILAQILGRRGWMLYEGIATLVGERVDSPSKVLMKLRDVTQSAPPQSNASVLTQVLAHPLIATLAQPGARPSYVPSVTFADAFVQVLSNGGSIAAVRASLADRTSHLGRLFGPMLDDANGDLEGFKARVGEQFNAVMDRVQGWYKRRTQMVLAVVGLVAAVALNVDLLHVARRLESDEALRARLVQTAAAAHAAARTVEGVPAKDAAAVTQDLSASTERLQKQIDELSALGVPIGWAWDDAGKSMQLLPNQTWGSACLGWLLAALAATLGAPFWFDLISRLIIVRGAGRKPDEDQASADARAKSATVSAIVSASSPAESTALNDFEASRLTGDDIEALQRALGVPEARIDGVLREDMRAALREWQRVTGRAASGRFDEATVMALLYG